MAILVAFVVCVGRGRRCMPWYIAAGSVDNNANMNSYFSSRMSFQLCVPCTRIWKLHGDICPLPQCYGATHQRGLWSYEAKMFNTEIQSLRFRQIFRSVQILVPRFWSLLQENMLSLTIHPPTVPPLPCTQSRKLRYVM